MREIIETMKIIRCIPAGYKIGPPENREEKLFVWKITLADRCREKKLSGRGIRRNGRLEKKYKSCLGRLERFGWFSC
jgi:hypothetical protein